MKTKVKWKGDRLRLEVLDVPEALQAQAQGYLMHYADELMVNLRRALTSPLTVPKGAERIGASQDSEA